MQSELQYLSSVAFVADGALSSVLRVLSFVYECPCNILTPSMSMLFAALDARIATHESVHSIVEQDLPGSFATRELRKTSRTGGASVPAKRIDRRLWTL